MGNIFRSILDRFYCQRKFRILMLGLDGVGKTTISQKLRLVDLATVPTIGFNVDEIVYKNITFVVWDVGGQDMIRSQWTHFYNNTDALIFVIDSEDRERMSLVIQELETLAYHHHLYQIPFLIYANKQDCRRAMPVIQIIKTVRIDQILAHKPWQVQGTCALTGQGLYEGLDWLNKVLIKRK